MKRGIFGEKIPIFGFALLRFAPQLRLTDTMKESEFTSLVLPLRDRMFRYAQSLLLSPAEAEDAVHDLLERLWRERGRLEGCRRVDSFVMTAVRNRCLDLLRRQRAAGRRDDAVAGWMERSAAAEADRWEMRELVRRALACLPGRQREVLHLKDIEGYSTREIAGMVGCDEAQVRVILSRARNDGFSADGQTFEAAGINNRARKTLIRNENVRPCAEINVRHGRPAKKSDEFFCLFRGFREERAVRVSARSVSGFKSCRVI